MSISRARARVLACRALARDIVLPLPGEALTGWGERLLAACGLDPCLLETQPGDHAEPAGPVVAAMGPVPGSPVEALLELSTIAEQQDGRRRRGAFYTADDVCVHVARSCIVPLADRPRAGGRNAPLVVLDPTCGSGAFLRAAAATLDADDPDGGPGQARVHGVDIDVVAVECCRLLLALDARSSHPEHDHSWIDAAIASNIQVGDAIADPRWDDRFPAAMQSGGFDAIVGNPPYVRARSVDHPNLDGMATHSCENTYAWVVERAIDALAPAGRLGMVVPVSSLCGDALAPLRSLLENRCCRIWAASFDAVPSTLFPGVVQRLAIITAERRRVMPPARSARWHVTRYHKWRASERAGLLDRIRYVERPRHAVNGSIAKVGTTIEHGILDRIFAHPPAARLMARGTHADGSNRFWYKRRWSYFLLFTDFVPPILDADGTEREPTEFKPVDVVPQLDYRALMAAYASSTFHWFFTTYSDNRNVNRRELEAFPFAVPAGGMAGELASLGDELMDALRASAEMRTCTYRSIGTIHNTYFRQAMTRPVIDRIDDVLARHYGLTSEQHAFLQAFEGEYRAAPTAAVELSGVAAAPR